MKHFIEARQDAIAALRDPAITDLTEKICLVVDLKGKCWILAKPAPNRDHESVKNAIRQVVKSAADVFWHEKILLEGTGAQADKAVFETAWNQSRPEPAGQNRIFVLDRRLSKDAWLGAPILEPWPLNDHTPPIISFYSFKGGVGRTTALLAVALNLAQAGKKAVVIDFDLEAPGAGLNLPPAQGVPRGLGVLDFLIDSAVVPRGSLDINEFLHVFDDRRSIKEGEPIYVVPAGNLDHSYLEKLSRVNYGYLYSSAQMDMDSSPLHSLLKMLRASFTPDVFLIDSRAGLHDLGGLSLSGLAHLQILFGLDSLQSWEGLKLAIAHLGKDMVLSGLTQRGCAVVQSMVSPRNDVRSAQIRSFRESSFQIFSDSYYDAPGEADAEWQVPDPESTESPHFPAVISYNEGLAGYSSVNEVVQSLCEGEHRSLAQWILEKVGETISR